MTLLTTNDSWFGGDIPLTVIMYLKRKAVGYKWSSVMVYLGVDIHLYRPMTEGT